MLHLRRKDDRGSSGFAPNGIVQRAVKAVKDQVPGLMVVTDVCIDEYTDHGHCGIVKDGRILNDETLECLRAMARTHAQAGADMVAPSGEGGERSMRQALAMLDPDRKVNYINAHGTSTPAGDVTEVQAVRNIFGQGSTPPISSTKSLTGHSLGATSVHEAIYSLSMMENSFISASANVQELDPALDTSEIVTTRQDNVELDTILSNSFGFGGTNATLIMSKFNG